MSGCGFHSHQVSVLQGQIVDVVEVSLACILELDLNKVRHFLVLGDVCQVVEGVQLPVVTRIAAFGAETPAPATAFIAVFHYFLSSIIILRAKSNKTICAFAFCSMSR